MAERKRTACCADADGRVVARAVGGPSNPLRGGLCEGLVFAERGGRSSCCAAMKITRGATWEDVCAGLGGAGREVVVRQVHEVSARQLSDAQLRVTSDLEIALEAAWGAGEGMILLAGTGSAALGRDARGRLARAGGRGPWIGDEGSAFDIGRQAVRRGGAGGGKSRAGQRCSRSEFFNGIAGGTGNSLQDRHHENADDVFPKTFPLVAELADDGDGVSRESIWAAAAALAELAACVAAQLGWLEREVAIGKVGGVHGRSEFLDAALEEELQRVVPQARLVSPRFLPRRLPRESLSGWHA